MAGGSGGPPSLAAPRTQMAAPWQPVRRHLRLRTRCPRPPPGTGRSERGEPARGPPTGWIQGIPGATAPPALGQLGCGGMRVGTAAARGALAHGHPKPWEDPGVQGSFQHLNPCIGMWADTGTPDARPRTGDGRAEASRHPCTGPRDQSTPRTPPRVGPGSASPAATAGAPSALGNGLWTL